MHSPKRSALSSFAPLFALNIIPYACERVKDKRGFWSIFSRQKDLFSQSLGSLLVFLGAFKNCKPAHSLVLVFCKKEDKLLLSPLFFYFSSRFVANKISIRPLFHVKQKSVKLEARNAK